MPCDLNTVIPYKLCRSVIKIFLPVHCHCFRCWMNCCLKKMMTMNLTCWKENYWNWKNCCLSRIRFLGSHQHLFRCYGSCRFRKKSCCKFCHCFLERLNCSYCHCYRMHEGYRYEAYCKPAHHIPMHNPNSKDSCNKDCSNYKNYKNKGCNNPNMDSNSNNPCKSHNC